jgi:hypothetical protein
MREKLGPWIPAIFCAFLSLITVLGNLILDFMFWTSRSGLDIVFYCNLPMCFYFVGMFLSKLREENTDLRLRIDDLTPAPNAEKNAA